MASTRIEVNVAVTADNARALAAVNSLKAAFNGVASAAAGADKVGGLPNTARQIGAIRATLATFRQALVAYAAIRVAASAVGFLVTKIDEFTLMNARVKNSAGSASAAAKAYAQLGAVASETSIPIGQLANFYGRTADQVMLFGKSSGDAVGLTRALALGLKASAATSEESASAFLQFSQAINSGRLAGEEFRAVYEAAPKLIQAYSQAMGVSAATLYEQAKAQKLTTEELIKYSAEVNKILEKQAAAVPTALGAQWKNLTDNFSNFIASASTKGNGFWQVINDNVARASRFWAQWAAEIQKTDAVVDASGKSLGDYGSEIEKTGDAIEKAKIQLSSLNDKLDELRKKNVKTAQKQELEAVNDVLKKQESLVEALRGAWEDARKEAQSYYDKAKEVVADAAAKASDRKRSGMTDEKAQLDASVESGYLYLATQRRIQQIKDAIAKGDADSLRIARELGKQVERDVKRQEDLLDQQDPRYVESLAARNAKQAAEVFKALGDLAAPTEDLRNRLLEEEKALAALEAKLKAVEAEIELINGMDLKVEQVTLEQQVEAARLKVMELSAAIDELNAKKIQSFPGAADAMAEVPAAPTTDGFARGGPIRPPNAIDKLLGWFNEDEFVLQASAARKIGLSKLNFMNRTGQIPAFAAGGPVGTPVHLHLDGHTVGPMMAGPSVAKQLGRLLSIEVLKRGRR